MAEVGRNKTNSIEVAFHSCTQRRRRIDRLKRLLAGHFADNSGNNMQATPAEGVMKPQKRLAEKHSLRRARDLRRKSRQKQRRPVETLQKLIFEFAECPIRLPLCLHRGCAGSNRPLQIFIP